MEQKEKELQPQTRAYTVEEIAAILHIGRSSAYTLVKKGYFKSVRIGTAIRISRKSFDEWLDQLELQSRGAYHGVAMVRSSVLQPKSLLKNKNKSFQHLTFLHDIMNNKTDIFPRERR